MRLPAGRQLCCARVSTMRKLVEKAYHACYDKVANIVAFSYDGQWHNLMTKGKDGEP